MRLPLSPIPRDQALRYAGWQGSALPPELEALLQDCIHALEACCTPRYVWRRLKLTREDGSLSAGGLILPGRALPALLEGCESCVVFALTLGDAPEGLIRRASVTDRTRALLLDACASAACEQSCDDLQALLAGQFQKEGLFVTDRYSPGYGDLPLTLQPQLLALLDAERKIGLTLTDTCLMTPRKSVTALFGLSGRPPARHASGCQSCSLKETCSYRKAGISCRSRSGS